MHPAISVIAFTTLSGAGYGLLCWLGLYAAAGLLPADRIFGAVSMILALGSVSIGLLSSTFHLGHPERAWRAFSQWRTSWLSREGVASVLTYIPAAIFGGGWVFLQQTTGPWGIAGLVSSVCAVLTVVCTAYIYRSLKPIPRWHNHWVAPNYLALSLMTGALLLLMLSHLFGYALPGLNVIALVAVAAAFFAKIGYWHFIDNAHQSSTIESATGLGYMGKVKLFEAPHTSENYLLKEMGYRIARKHARKLRMISLAFGFLVPFALVLASCAVTGIAEMMVSLFAAIIAMIGVLTERWLFFAEAKHSVTLFYGRSLNA